MFGKVVWPLSYNVIRGRALNHTFGMVRKNKDGSPRPHQGWDFEAAIGTTAHAIADGRVEFIQHHGDYGSQVCIGFNLNGQTLYSFYAHMARILVKPGARVLRGEVIGTTGKSGNAGNLPVKEHHLHFEIRTSPRLGGGLVGRLSPMHVFRMCPLQGPVLQPMIAPDFDHQVRMA